MLLISQIVSAELNGVSQGIEVASALLRVPAVALSKKALQDKKIKQAYILSVAADFIRLTNDLSALYNLCDKNDFYWYKWTKAMWVGQDLVSLFTKVKHMSSNKPEKWNDIESDVDSEYEIKLNKQLSEFVKKLDIYVLPAIEGLAATVLALDSGEKDSDLNSLSLPMQAVVSGSRLLSEMIEAKSGSIEQKLVIAKTIIHALILIFQPKLPMPCVGAMNAPLPMPPAVEEQTEKHNNNVSGDDVAAGVSQACEIRRQESVHPQLQNVALNNATLSDGGSAAPVALDENLFEPHPTVAEALFHDEQVVQVEVVAQHDPVFYGEFEDIGTVWVNNRIYSAALARINPVYYGRYWRSDE